MCYFSRVGRKIFLHSLFTECHIKCFFKLAFYLNMVLHSQDFLPLHHNFLAMMAYNDSRPLAEQEVKLPHLDCTPKAFSDQVSQRDPLRLPARRW